MTITRIGSTFQHIDENMSASQKSKNDMFAEGSANVIQLGNDLRKVPQMRFSSGMTCGRFRKCDSAREQTCGRFRKRDSTRKQTCGRFRKRVSTREQTCGRFRKRVSTRKQTCGEMRKKGKKRKHTRALFLECVSIM